MNSDELLAYIRQRIRETQDETREEYKDYSAEAAKDRLLELQKIYNKKPRTISGGNIKPPRIVIK